MERPQPLLPVEGMRLASDPGQGLDAVALDTRELGHRPVDVVCGDQVGEVAAAFQVGEALPHLVVEDPAVLVDVFACRLVAVLEEDPLADLPFWDRDVRSIEHCKDPIKAPGGRESGGIYITTIQKFSEDIGLLSERSNIICISDEAHRLQLGVDHKLKKADKGVFTQCGFAEYLRQSFPNATYCGFTGTPIDATIMVFGPVVVSYMMKEFTDDGITVRIAYEPRLARVQLSEQQAKGIQRYYDKCAAGGSTPEQIEES